MAVPEETKLMKNQTSNFRPLKTVGVCMFLRPQVSLPPRATCFSAVHEQFSQYGKTASPGSLTSTDTRPYAGRRCSFRSKRAMLEIGLHPFNSEPEQAAT